jgi:hypothetical protein
VAADLIHSHLHATVVEQQNVTRVDVFNEFGIVESNPALIAEGAFNVEYTPVALAQFDPPLREFSDPDLWALKVGQDSNVAPKTRRKTPNKRDARRMLFGSSVRKVHPNHVDPGSQNPLKNFRIGSGGTKGRDYFGRAMR